ncbi:hypothetical protein BJ170DRAFT_37042 [Xylariales sp. AK1849]|nr:hypothetical protein BJ170DRAFT_37042 [Xylariales sp. AK1849]
MSMRTLLASLTSTAASIPTTRLHSTYCSLHHGPAVVYLVPDDIIEVAWVSTSLPATILPSPRPPTPNHGFLS